jgi:hypothetical protein
MFEGLGRLPEALRTPSAFLVIVENPAVLLHLLIYVIK